MIDSKDIKFTCSDSADDSLVSFYFNAAHMNAQDMFMQWVRFMNAIGYVLDPAEMEEMWSER